MWLTEAARPTQKTQSQKMPCGSAKVVEGSPSAVPRASIGRQMAAASQEQASGIEQINQAISQMDQTTQQNAALVEEATSASQSMKQQAAGLVEQVAFFKAPARVGIPGNKFTRSISSQALRSKGTGTTKKAVIAKSANVPATGHPVGVAGSNGKDRRKRDDNFFEEF